MKKLLSCFLFAPRPSKLRGLYYIWNWFFIIAAGVGAGLCSILLAFGHYSWEIAWGYFTHSLIAALNILPPVFLVLLLYLIIGRAWIAFLAGGLPILLASIGNYFKLLCRDDPFMFIDASAIGTALKVSENYDISLDERLFFCIAAYLIITLFLFFFVRLRPKKLPRFICALVLLISAFPVSKLYLSNDIYENKTENFEHISRWSATQVYISKGFVYPFIHSIPSAFPEKPEGYSDAAAKEILSAYSSEDIPGDRKVNIIAIQLEAFADLERIGFEGINKDVYKAYHMLEEESLSGNLLTNIFAGGTIDTERCFATGYFTLDDFRKDTGSYARYFASQGYYTEGAHPCYDWFYNRRNVNSYLGFENYYFIENRYADMTGGIALDDVFITDILELYNARDKDTPYFNLSVSYQGHGPYTMTGLDWGDGYREGDCASDESYYILSNYLGSVKNTSENLVKLKEALKDDEAPVLLVVFGDHKPWLGYSNSVYNENYINLDTSTVEGFYNYFGTRYLIWANNAAKECLENDFIGEGPDISPCFLMNLIFDEAGLGKGSEYMQLMDELMEETTVLHSYGYYMQNGELVRSMGEKGTDLLAKAKIAQFYRKRHAEY